MTTQLTFDLEGGSTAVKPSERPGLEQDRLIEKIVAAGLAPNEYILRLNRGLTNPDTLSLPSRMFRFPLEFVELDRLKDRDTPYEQRLLLKHPALSDLPFVTEVAGKLGFAPSWSPADEFGRDRGALPRWWHACDLMSEKHWKDLLETRHLTDDPMIAGALVLSLTHHRRNAVSIAAARAVLDAIGSVEPSVSRSARLFQGGGLRPAYIEPDKLGKGGHWALNLRGNGEESAWMTVHGLEENWIAYGKNGYATLSPKGCDLLGLDPTPPRRGSDDGLSGATPARPRSHGR